MNYTSMKKIFELSPNMDMEREVVAERIMRWLEKELGDDYKDYQLIIEVIKN